MSEHEKILGEIAVELEKRGFAHCANGKAIGSIVDDMLRYETELRRLADVVSDDDVRSIELALNGVEDETRV
jgi:hypothetical protein